MICSNKSNKTSMSFTQFTTSFCWNQRERTLSSCEQPWCFSTWDFQSPSWILLTFLGLRVYWGDKSTITRFLLCRHLSRDFKVDWLGQHRALGTRGNLYESVVYFADFKIVPLDFVRIMKQAVDQIQLKNKMAATANQAEETLSEGVCRYCFILKV